MLPLQALKPSARFVTAQGRLHLLGERQIVPGMPPLNALGLPTREQMVPGILADRLQETIVGDASVVHVGDDEQPLAASWATALAALRPDAPARREELLRLVAEVLPWEVAQDSEFGIENSPRIPNAESRIPLMRARELIRGGVRRTAAEGAGLLRRRWVDPARGAATGLRDLRPGL